MNTLIESVSDKIFDRFKKITPALIAIAILTGLLLFLPEPVLERMNLDKLPVLWSRIIGIVFLLSVSLICAIVISTFVTRLVLKRKNKRIKTSLKKKFVTLSPQQKNIVSKLLRSRNKAIELDKNSGDTIYLEHNLFIYMPQQPFIYEGDSKMILTYVPQPWLLELYNEEPDLFE